MLSIRSVRIYISYPNNIGSKRTDTCNRGNVMEWIKNYQLFLFDFDGLLVDTEHMHYKAYLLMCKNRGFELVWSFQDFTNIAHFNAVGLKENIYSTLPSLQELEPNWSVLYKEKQALYQQMLVSEGVFLMPGVEAFLTMLEKQNIKRVVVTNSVKTQTDLIISFNPLLKTIPYWITREQYINPKPAGDCYQLALKRHCLPGERAIGFEDTPRGIQALQQSAADAVLISSNKYEGLGVKHYFSFDKIESLL